MDLKEIKAVLKLLEGSDVEEIEFEQDGRRAREPAGSPGGHKSHQRRLAHGLAPSTGRRRLALTPMCGWAIRSGRGRCSVLSRPCNS